MLGGLQYGDQKLTPSFHTNVQRAKADSFTAPTPRTSSRKGRGSKTQPANDTKSAPTSRRATRASSIRSVNNDEPPVEAPLTEVGYPHHIFLSKARGRWPRLSVGVDVGEPVPVRDGADRLSVSPSSALAQCTDGGSGV